MEYRKTKSNYELQVDMAKKIFLKYDQELLIRKYQLSADPDWIYLSYFNESLRINRLDGRCEECIDQAWVECRSFSTVMTVYDLLCHSKGTTMPVLSNNWCSVGSFVVTGVQNAETFSREFAASFQTHFQQLPAACRKLGGIAESSKAGADVCFRIPVTPFLPVLLQFWQEDDEFPPQIRLMWDQNTLCFLHFETTFYLQGDLLDRIRKQFA